MGRKDKIPTVIRHRFDGINNKESVWRSSVLLLRGAKGLSFICQRIALGLVVPMHAFRIISGPTSHLSTDTK